MIVVVSAAVVLMLDQISKLIIKSTLRYAQVVYLLGDLLKLTYVRNSGIAFGFLRGRFYLIVPMISLTILLLIVIALKLKGLSRFSKICLGMIIGGALGNFTDRLLFRNVVDFISILDFPVFNVADSSIVLGTIFLGIRLLIHEKLESGSDASGNGDREIHSDNKGKGMEIGQVPDEQATILDLKNNDPEGNKVRQDTGEWPDQEG